MLELNLSSIPWNSNTGNELCAWPAGGVHNHEFERDVLKSDYYAHAICR